MIIQNVLNMVQNYINFIRLDSKIIVIEYKINQMEVDD